MAKKDKKKKGVDATKALSTADLKHYRNTEIYAGMVKKLYDQAVDDLGIFAKAVGLPKGDEAFSFDMNKTIAKQVEQTITNLAGRIVALVQSGNRKEWSAACDKSDEFIKNVMGTSVLTEKTLQSYQDRNIEALNAFQERKVNGLNLSERVWMTVSRLKTEAELAVDTIGAKKKGYHPAIDAKMQMTKFDRAIGSGMSAAEFSREIRSCLLEPNKLFRRVRDKYGNLHLSKAAELYHPGQGVYRSSYKNAMRMTRSEINMAYRQSDKMRWDQLDFVVGFEVQLSNNHTCLGKDGKPHPFKDICDELAGKYPKDFKFVGWHPQCRCHAVPILQDRKEMMENRKHMDDPKFRPKPASNAVKDVPEGFKTYIKENYDRIEGLNGWKGWQSKPYYYTDNAQYVDKVMNPEKYQSVSLDLSIEEQKLLSDYEMYAFNHQGSKLFAKALEDAKEAVLRGDREAFDLAMAEMAARKAKNDASVISKAKKRGEEALAPVIDINALIKQKMDADMKQYSAAQIKNMEELAEAIKQKKGLSMSFEEANTGKENPHFKEFEEAKKYIQVVDAKGLTHYELNPEYSKLKGWAENCQTCTLVHEMRRRGFNIEAMSNYRGKVWGIYKKEGVGTANEGYRVGKWLDQDGKPVGYYYAHEWAAANNKGFLKTKEDIMEYFNDMTKEDGRYEVCVDWKGGSAHVFCLERKDGKLVSFDPQSGKENVIDGYIAKAKIHTFGVIRTDDKLINPKLAATFIPDGEIPIVVDVSMSPEEIRKQKIKEAAEKRHAARTPQKVMELTKFAQEHKEKTEKAYEEVNNLAEVAMDIEESNKNDIKKLVSMALAKEGVKMSDGRIAGMSLEKLKEQAMKLKPVVEEFETALSDAKSIVSDFSGVKNIDIDSVLKQKSIAGLKEETKKLEQKKNEIIADVVRLKNDFDGVLDLDMKEINEIIKSGKLSSILEVSDKINEIKKAEESLSDLIPNAHELHKAYPLSELQNAHKELDGVLNKWLSKYSYSSIDNAPLDHLKNKLDFELSSPTFRYTNKDIIDRAISEKIAIINRKIEWNNLVSQLDSLKSFNTKASTYKNLLKKVELAISNNNLDELKKSIADAEAEQRKILEKRAKKGGDVKTALNKEYRGGAIGSDISSSVDVRNMVSEDPYRGTFTNNIARMQGFDGPAKLVSETEFNMLEKDCGEVFYRTVNPTTFRGKQMSSKEFASQLYVAEKLELNGPGGRVYGDGMYVAVSAWDGRNIHPLTASRKTHAYNASVCYGDGNHTISEMTFTRKPKIIKENELDVMWSRLSYDERAKYGHQPNTYACALGYDAMYTGRDYMVIWNRTIIAVKKQ